MLITPVRRSDRLTAAAAKTCRCRCRYRRRPASDSTRLFRCRRFVLQMWCPRSAQPSTTTVRSISGDTGRSRCSLALGAIRGACQKAFVHEGHEKRFTGEWLHLPQPRRLLQRQAQPRHLSILAANTRRCSAFRHGLTQFLLLKLQFPGSCAPNAHRDPEDCCRQGAGSVLTCETIERSSSY